jgi:VanZ family protein
MKYIVNKNIIYIYISAIFIVSLIPPTKIVGEIQKFGIDKAFHLIEYFILGVLTHFFIKNRKKLFKIMYILIALVPIIDEYLIQRISGRTIDVWDFIFNIIGLYLGTSMLFLIYKYRDKKTDN